MIVHTARFAFKPDVGEAEQADVLEALQRSGAGGLVAFSFIGQDLGDESEGYTHAFCAGWESLEDFGRYLEGAGHRDFVALFVAHVGRFAVTNMTDDTDPSFGEKFQQTHNAWIADDPALAAQLGAIVAN